MASPWTVDQLNNACLVGPLSAVVHLGVAAPGLQGLTVAGRNISGVQLLAVELGRPRPDEAIAAYVREGDLVVTFEEVAQSPIRVQAYWRTSWPRDLPGVFAGADLEVSVQTSLLDSDPRLTVQGRLERPAEIWRLADDGWQKVAAPAELTPASGTSCLLFRYAEGPSYFEMTHPADFRRVQLVENSAWLEMTRPLFGHDLEKGVILRSRIRGGFAARADDQACAAAAWQAFVESPIPLTT